MKKLTCLKGFVLLATILILVAGCDTIDLSFDNPVEGWLFWLKKMTIKM